MPAARRFPPPWTIEETEPGRRTTGKLPELVKRPQY